MYVATRNWTGVVPRHGRTVFHGRTVRRGLLTCILMWLWNFLSASSTSRFDKSISLHNDFKIFFVFSVPLPRNSPRTCRLIPFRVTRKLAMTFGLSATNECLMRKDNPFSGFLLKRFNPIRYIRLRTNSLFDGGSPDWTQLLLWRRLKITGKLDPK